MSLLITFAYMREETDISQSVEDNILENRIRRAGDQLEFLLGRAFYDELVGQYSTTPRSFNADNLAFYDPYVKQFIAWQAYEFYIARANGYETRMGVRIFKEENSDPASDKMMGERSAEAKKMTPFYRERMLNYLREQQRIDSTKYPLYTNTCSTSTGSGFGITAVSKIDTVNFHIDRTIQDNGRN